MFYFIFGFLYFLDFFLSFSKQSEQRQSNATSIHSILCNLRVFGGLNGLGKNKTYKVYSIWTLSMLEENVIVIDSELRRIHIESEIERMKFIERTRHRKSKWNLSVVILRKHPQISSYVSYHLIQNM